MILKEIYCPDVYHSEFLVFSDQENHYVNFNIFSISFQKRFKNYR